MKCNKCLWEWKARVKTPIACPQCHCRKWNKKKKGKCKICKRNFKSLAIHHINGNHSDNKNSNIISICSDCHSAIHTGTNKTKRRARAYGTSNQTKQVKGDREAIILIKHYRCLLWNFIKKLKEEKK